MKHNHLSVVETKDFAREKVGHKQNPRFDQAMAPLGCQLLLPLEGEAGQKRVVVVAMDQLHGTQFCKLILKIKPLTAVDLRHLIRFDLPGTSRTEVFSCFSSVHAQYVNASLPWHKLKPKDFMIEGEILSQSLSYEVIERKEGPIMLLVSKEADVRFLTSYLNRLLSSFAKRSWVIELVH